MPEREKPENKVFNNHVSMGRIRSEHAIGYLKGQFQSLKGVTISPFPCACSCCVPSHTDTCFSFPFLFSYARGRYALIGHFAYHVTPEVSASRDLACLPLRFPFLSHVTLTVLVCVMATRLDLFFVTLTFSCLCFLLIRIC